VAAVGAIVVGEAAGRGVGLRIDYPNVGVDAAVGIGVVVADKGDLRAVGRPHRLGFVEFGVAVGEFVELVRGDVKQKEMRVLVVAQVAGNVLFKQIAVDDDGLRLWLFAGLRVGAFFGRDGENELR